jgi:PEP-CTERM motif-containing protein
MNMLRILRACGIVAGSLFMAIPAVANSAVTFTFSGLNNNEQALNYFWGAYGSLGSGPGPNYEISFSPNAMIVSGAKGNLLTGNGTIVMNVHTEFANSFKLGYVTLAPEVVNVWSGYDGTGYLLATMTLMPNGWCHSVTKCGWAHAGEPFPGAAASVTFSGAGNEFGIGSIKIGTYYWSKRTGTVNGMATTATPEPSSMVLLSTGLAGLMWIYMRRKRTLSSAIALRRTYFSQ